MIRWGFKGMRKPFDVPVLALMIATLWKACGGNWEAAFHCTGFLFIGVLQVVPPAAYLYTKEQHISGTSVRLAISQWTFGE
jgi:hypothetical protein